MKLLRAFALTTALGFAVTPAFADITIRPGRPVGA